MYNSVYTRVLVFLLQYSTAIDILCFVWTRRVVALWLLRDCVWHRFGDVPKALMSKLIGLAVHANYRTEQYLQV